MFYICFIMFLAKRARPYEGGSSVAEAMQLIINRLSN